MKRIWLSALAVGVFWFATTSISSAADKKNTGFTKIFNGKDLTGWTGNPELWSVKDQAIVGQTTAEKPVKDNTFLIWTNGEVTDFELRLSFKIAPNNDKGFANSGIQFRSKVVDEKNWVVGGYQADMEAGPNYCGILYDERGVAGGRGIMAARGEKVVWDKDCKKQVTGKLEDADKVQASIQPGHWSGYTIIVQGSHIQQFINDFQTVDVTDECEAKALKSGVIALQLHAGLPMTVQFKNVRLKQLKGASTAATSSDLDRMQGEWTVTELVVNGEKVSADLVTSAKLQIKGNQYYLHTDSESSRGTLKLLDRNSPKTMDVQTDDGTDVPAIYEISGDTMKACYALNGAARPKEFKSDSGSDHVFAIYKRKAN